jgi:hypothetical protein
MGIRSLGIYGLPTGLLLGGWIAEEVGAQAMIGVLGGIGLFATLAAAVAWPALLRTSAVVPHESTSTGHLPGDKNI